MISYLEPPFNHGVLLQSSAWSDTRCAVDGPQCSLPSSLLTLVGSCMATIAFMREDCIGAFRLLHHDCVPLRLTCAQLSSCKVGQTFLRDFSLFIGARRSIALWPMLLSIDGDLLHCYTYPLVATLGINDRTIQRSTYLNQPCHYNRCPQPMVSGLMRSRSLYRTDTFSDQRWSKSVYLRECNQVSASWRPGIRNDARRYRTPPTWNEIPC